MGREDPLEKEMANPLQYSYLENPMDRGAWSHKMSGTRDCSHAVEDGTVL